MTAKPLRAAIVGLGNHARRNLAPAIEASPRFELADCCTRDREVGADFADQYGVRVFDDVSALLAESDADCVVIATPTGVHFEQVSACLKAGKHCLVEKTAFSNFDESSAAVELAESRELAIMEGFMFRFHAQFAALRNYLDGLEPNSVRMLDCRFGFPHLGPDDIRYSRELAGGALNDCGAYTVSSARALLGDDVRLRFSRVSSQAGHDVDTEGLAVLEDGSGCVANCSWMFGASYQNRIAAWCSDRIVTVERAYSKPPALETAISVHANGEVIDTIAVPPCNHFVEMLDALAEAVRGHRDGRLHKEMVEQARVLQMIRDFRTGSV